jgi:hypothetical protein
VARILVFTRFTFVGAVQQIFDCTFGLPEGIIS